MTLDENLQKTIERYLKGRLEGDELADFEHKLERNSIFAEEVKLQQQANALIKVYGKRKHFQEQLDSVSQSYENTKNIQFIIQPILLVATVLSLFLMTYLTLEYFGISPTNNNQQIATEQFRPYQNILITRPNKDTSVIAHLEREASRSYNEKKYTPAIYFLNQLLKQDSTTLTYNFYAGLCHLSLQQSKKALPYLKKARRHDDRSLRDHAEWYMVLAYLQMDERKEAVFLLKLITVTDIHDHKQEAQQLLDRLR